MNRHRSTEPSRRVTKQLRNPAALDMLVIPVLAALQGGCSGATDSKATSSGPSAPITGTCLPMTSDTPPTSSDGGIDCAFAPNPCGAPAFSIAMNQPTPFNGTGGTIVEGTYYVTHIDLSSAEKPPGGMHAEYRFTHSFMPPGTTLYGVVFYADDWGGPAVSYKNPFGYGIFNAHTQDGLLDMFAQTQCGGGGLGTVGYTATSTQIVLYMGTANLTLTKQ